MPTKSFDRTIVLRGESVDRIISYERKCGESHSSDPERIEVGKEALKKFQPQKGADKSIKAKAL